MVIQNTDDCNHAAGDDTTDDNDTKWWHLQ